MGHILLQVKKLKKVLCLTRKLGEYFIIKNIKYCSNFIYLTSVVRKLDNAIHWINRYPVDKY